MFTLIRRGWYIMSVLSTQEAHNANFIQYLEVFPTDHHTATKETTRKSTSMNPTILGGSDVLEPALYVPQIKMVSLHNV
jgi:hypothetical protein